MMNARNNPNKRSEIIFCTDRKSADEKRKEIRDEWLWYRKALKVVEGKPKLRKMIENKLAELDSTYRSIIIRQEANQ